MIGEDIRQTWRDGNRKVRLGMVAIGVGFAAVTGAIGCELLDGVSIDGHVIELQNESLGLLVGGSGVLLGGQQAFIQGIRETQDR